MKTMTSIREDDDDTDNEDNDGKTILIFVEVNFDIL